VLQRILKLAILGALGAGLAFNAQDIMRYLKMRQM
jgi:hypothetical protein